MEAKFTKGEWKAKTDDSCIKTAIIHLSDKGGFDISGAPDCIENAHLIAVAPEMYELLKAFSEMVIPTTSELYEHWEKANLLLSKARGE